MRYLLSILLFICCYPIGAQTHSDVHQVRRHEVNFGFAVASCLRTTSTYKDYESRMQEEMGIRRASTVYDLGPIILRGGYYYHFNDKIAIGGTVGYVSSWYPYRTDTWYEDDLKAKSYYVMSSCKYYWFNSSWVRIYSSVALGLQYQKFYLTVPDDKQKEEQHTHVAYHLTGAGVEIGKKNIRLQLQLGYGLEGIGGMGMSFHF